MAKYKLVPFTIKLRKKGAKKYLTLSDIDGKGSDFLNLITQTFQALQSTEVLDKFQKTITIDKLEGRDREIYGIIKSGDYGYTADFFDTHTNVLLPAMRKPRHSEVIPFFYLISVPENSLTGFLILQTFQVYGIKTALHEALKARQEFTNYILEIRHFISYDVMQKLTLPILEVSFIRHDVPKDIADRVVGNESWDIKEKRIFTLGGRKISRKLKDFFSNRETRYYEVREEEYEEIKVVVQDGPSTKTLTFGDDYRFYEAWSLEDFEEQADGFPKPDYFLEKALEYLERIKRIHRGIE